MPRIIVKLMDGTTPYYLEWSTIVDAPITYGLSLDEFKTYYQNEYGRSGMEDLARRLAVVEEYGSSCREPPGTLILCNRAGPNEACLSMDEILERYCRTRVGG